MNTVDELRALLAGLPGDVPVLVSGYGGGFATVAYGGVVGMQELDRGAGGENMGRFATPADAAEDIDGRGADWTHMVGGTPPRLVGEPITAVVLSREGR
ncbi:hypothetical protein LB823_04990 [Tsukamurella sp. M9C]|uniref:hypothetical protein n=1 Tax=unclassified Tsukamurella TaxID=2633480 RepID=UPI001CCF0FED|nr:hypothetical protein [Tsukamurella sp. M9C]MCA0155547.1 hypothetical protein [Tsukamurella sp. M9C]